MTDCSGCRLSGRREFLRRVSGAAAAALAALAIAPGEAAALTLGPIRALGGRGDERRYPLPDADGVSIDRDNSVILVRWHGEVFAFGLSCPHQHTALKWQDDHTRFQCPKHKSKYEPDGVFRSGRATRNMDRYAIRREGRVLIVDLGTLYRSDRQAAAWAAARVSA
jgi:nitrite reductase/ring-hydroxylating ferredoxin subunit